MPLIELALLLHISQFMTIQRADDKHILHCRAMVAIEMISRMGNKIWDFPSCPTLQEVS